MCMLLKLRYAIMQSLVFLTYFFQKLSKKNLWWSARPPPPLVQEGLESCVEIMKTSISVAIFWDFAVSSACCGNKVNNVSVKLSGRVPFTFVYGGVHIVGQDQTQNYGFTENFVPKNMGILHISYPKIWVTILVYL